MNPVLEVNGLTTRFHTRRGIVPAVTDVSFSVGPAETLAIVGESGSGKSVTALSVMRMVRRPGVIEGGQVLFGGRDLLALPESEMRGVRGAGIAMVFQDPMASLNPVMRIRDQLTEAMLSHGKFTRRQAATRAVDLMKLVGIPDPSARLADYPHAFSGGMRQRVMIAMAVADEPSLLIADEPTTALDVTVQAQVLELLGRLNRELGTAIVLITHNLGVVARLCDRAVVMRGGQAVESGAVSSLFSAAQHPYTRELLAATPRLRGPARPLRAAGPDLLTVSGVSKTYSGRRRAISALCDVSLTVRRGETVGLVGESGCGKSTLGKVVLGIEKSDSGTLTYDGQDVTRLDRRGLRALREKVQIVFQDPYSSLNPRLTAGQTLGEPLRLHGRTDVTVAELLALVGLEASAADRYPHEFSGGQRQRIAIARALAAGPELIVCDEAVSSLDVSRQAQIVRLLGDLQRRLGLSYLFIGHDLATIRTISDRIAVMYLGQIVEIGTSAAVVDSPAHPYTASLLSAVPEPDPAVERNRERIVLTGDVPSPAAPPPGCRFHTRCPIGPLARSDRDICRTTRPVLRPSLGGSLAACHFLEEGSRA